MFTYDGQHRSARASVEHLDNIVMIDGLSKSHAMSGWRMGWVIAPPQLIERLGDYSAATLFGSPQFIQDASAFALENDQAYVASMRKEYRARRDFVLRKLSKVSQLSCSRPRAGMFIMCDVSGTGHVRAGICRSVTVRQSRFRSFRVMPSGRRRQALCVSAWPRMRSP